jgi:glycosyltransferase involved in cell wall biosynthesis
VAPVSEVDAAALRALGLGERVRVVPVAARLAVERRNGRGEGWPRVVVAGNFTIPSIAADARRFLAAWRGRDGVELVVWGRGASALRQEGAWAVEWVEDYAGFLASADVYVYPQRYAAGLQTKVQDAMRAGCAVVAASGTLLPLGVVDGREARCGASPEEMVAMAGELAREPERTRAMGRAARALMERRFGAEVVAAQLREALGVSEMAAVGRGGAE